MAGILVFLLIVLGERVVFVCGLRGSGDAALGFVLNLLELALVFLREAFLDLGVAYGRECVRRLLLEFLRELAGNVREL